ncbi:GLE1-like protein-domain-containing protein [Sordaria brevicollis]|uniref:mRNA export factor GLE1 n=1 Tax=Sordaria brevicollis TaxID=83679 RepID=A0AAE0UGJ4_SORBR|nr:GLE1-like protein-domain-containing protein [Sordaria brevicollis]
MAGSSPARPHGNQWASPSSRSVISDILAGDRNSEARHRLLIEAARREHERVREEAERVYQEHLLREEQERLIEERKKEEERIRQEEQLAAERRRVNALKAKKVEIPPVLPDPEPVKAPPPAPKPAPAGTPSQPPTAQINGTSLFGKKPETTPAASPAASKPFGGFGQTSTNAQPTAASKPSTPAINNLLGNNTQANVVTPPATVAKPPAPAPTQQGPDRLTVIHKNLKELRKSMLDQAKANPALKSRMGDMRREIRKCVGQLTGGGAGVNRQQNNKIAALLKEALENRVQSQHVDPNTFLVEPRAPVQGATNNDPQISSLFIYLLNVFAKATISQFINEGGPRPETADPVGVCIAAIFSDPAFAWRGASLIDILLAKFRIVCPVLWGYKGSEKTEQGRARIGWWKENGRWVTEQVHFDRMTGLGAGFAAISLRNFASSKKQNPYPPRHYWTAMAKIVNTPSAEISNTQCVVLKAMIQNYEEKFIHAYGTAALAALRTALIEFPTRAPVKSSAVSSLTVVYDLLRKSTGLVLG